MIVLSINLNEIFDNLINLALGGNVSFIELAGYGHHFISYSNWV